MPAGQQQGSRTLERAPRGQSASFGNSRSIGNQVRQFAGSAAETVFVRFRAMRSGLGVELALARGGGSPLRGQTFGDTSIWTMRRFPPNAQTLRHTGEAIDLRCALGPDLLQPPERASQES